MTTPTDAKARTSARPAVLAILLAALAALAWPQAGQARSQRTGSHRSRSPHTSSHRARPRHARAHQARRHHARHSHASSRQRHARTLHASDRATLHYVSSTVDVFYETGHASGTLPGFMRVHMRLGASFSGRYVIQARGGSIRGRGSATPHGSGHYESFAGTIIVTGGTGRYRHAHGHARVYGTFNRIDNQLKLHTTGTLHY